jgi:hypothetical protein
MKKTNSAVVILIVLFISLTSSAAGKNHVQLRSNAGIADSASCAASTIGLSNSSKTFSSSAGVDNVSVTFNPSSSGCEWSVSQNDCSWFNYLMPGDAQSFSGYISYSVPANTSTTDRSCTLKLTVGSKTYDYPVMQLGAPVCNPPLASPQVTLNDTCDLVAQNIQGVTYQWYVNGNSIQSATSQFYTATYPGNYYVLITDVSNCMAQSADIYVNCSTTGLSDGPEITNTSIFPNPTNGRFRISADLWSDKPVQAKLYTVLGQLVYSQYIQPVANKIDEEIEVDLPGGIYQLQLNHSGQYYNRTLVIR